MKLTSETYDFIKNVLLPVLTGGATFVIALGKLWDVFDEGIATAIAGTMTALATYISFVINSASKSYFKDKDIIEADINNKDISING